MTLACLQQESPLSLMFPLSKFSSTDPLSPHLGYKSPVVIYIFRVEPNLSPHCDSSIAIVLSKSSLTIVTSVRVILSLTVVTMANKSPRARREL